METKPLGSYLGICKQSEVLILSTIGIFCTIFDASLLHLWTDLHRIWTVLMDPVKMPMIMHLYIRYILSGVVIVKAFSLHVYLASYVVLLYPACTMERPQLILPWLFIGTAQTILLCTLTFTTGLYVCFMYRFMRPACWDFLLTQIVTHVPSFYMWALVLSYYRDLKKIEQITSEIELKSLCPVDISIRRKRAKSLVRSSSHCRSIYDDYEDNRQFISASTIENMVHHLGRAGKKKTVTSRSLDTLVGEMEMEADRLLLLGVENEESFVMDDNMSIQEKTAQLLKVSPMEIIRAKRERKLTRQIASSSKLTMLPALTCPSLTNTTTTSYALPTNLTSMDQEDAQTIITDSKPSCESETELRVFEFDNSKCLVRATTIAAEISESVINPVETKRSNDIEIVFSGSEATIKNIKKIKKSSLKQDASYDSLKSIRTFEHNLLVVKNEIQVRNPRTHKYDGYTEAYLRKKQHDEEAARKMHLRNLK